MTTRETGWFLLCEFFKVTWVLYASYADQGREVGSEIVHCAGTAGSQENLLGGAGCIKEVSLWQV